VLTQPPTAIAHNMANAGARRGMVRSTPIRCIVFSSYNGEQTIMKGSKRNAK
jgi:hypothetical protein